MKPKLTPTEVLQRIKAVKPKLKDASARHKALCEQIAHLEQIRDALWQQIEEYEAEWDLVSNYDDYEDAA